MGRWVSRDPIDYSGQGPNLYQYVDARPASLFDPLGLIPQDKGWDWPTFGEYCYYFCGSFDEDFDEDLGAIGNCTIETLELAVDLVPAGKGANCCKKVLGAAGDTRKGSKALTQAQESAIRKIGNIEKGHLTPHDYTGTLRDMVGNPVPKPGGGFWDHAQEMIDSLRGLRKHAKTLEGATDPERVNEFETMPRRI